LTITQAELAEALVAVEAALRAAKRSGS